MKFVSTATGNLSFAVTDIPTQNSLLPLMFRRAYASDRRADVGLGEGWSFAFDDRIALAGDKALMTTGEGAVIAFRRSGQSQHFVLQADELISHQSFDIVDKETITEQVSGLTRTYKKLGETYRLSQMADANGNAVSIAFDSTGNISRIASSTGGALTLEWSAGKDARLLSVTDTSGRRVSFRQDGQRLRVVTDASGAQWSYDYAGGRLTRATDPVGRVLARVLYDRAGRVVESADAAGSYSFEYAASGRTVVTDPLGAKNTYGHTANGLLTSVSDDEGRTSAYEYNAANRPTRISNSFGDETRFVYDDQNRLLRQSSNNGVEKAYTYDERGRVSSSTEGGTRVDYIRDARGNVVETRSDDPAKRSSASFNSRGQVVSSRTAAGNIISFEYDSAGNQTASSDPQAGRFETEHDSAGRVTAARIPSSFTQRSEYDARGLLVRLSDDSGQSKTYKRDASGLVTELVLESGHRLQARRDAAGRVVSITTSTGKSRHFGYDARGALTDYTDAKGKHSRLDYDHRGRLRGMVDDDGNKITIERDERGRPRSISSSDGSRRTYIYDRTGSLAAVQNEAAPVKSARASLKLTAHSSPKPMMIDCMFGGDEFLMVDSWGYYGSSCYDPYGGLDPYYGYYDPWGGYGYGWGSWGYWGYDPWGFWGYDHWGFYSWGFWGYDPWMLWTFDPFFGGFYALPGWRCIQATAAAAAAWAYAGYICSRASPSCPQAIRMAQALTEYARIVCGSGF
ncbi:MAG TPA: DUF6531 domain-containing protein [Pyrinomonadaceae bacterium]|nr:DUF6531 domain-containing protein [Pyrinomonadaceae bacterium]